MTAFRPALPTIVREDRPRTIPLVTTSTRAMAPTASLAAVALILVSVFVISPLHGKCSACSAANQHPSHGLSL